MQIGWVDFSKTERDKVVSILRLLGTQTALDELGIGTVRDAFSDMFFPGISTLQTRAKYFVILPYLFAQAENHRFKHRRDVLAYIHNEEFTLVKTLVKNSGPEAYGIVGSRNMEKMVKMKPSSIYWNGLRTVGILRYLNIMITIQGLYNTAVCYTPELEEAARKQIQTVCDQAEFAGCKIRIMPDVHAGKGCTIGTTMTIQDKIVPGMVGVDIGCGMETVELREREVDFEKLDALIRREIPYGREVRDIPHALNAEIDLTHLRCTDQVNLNRAMRSIGSLGGGNHFIEVDRAEDGRLFLVVHSGSRHLGTEVAEHYQNEGRRALWGGAQYQVQAAIDQLKAEGRFQEIQKTIKALKKEHELNIPKDLAYVEGKLFEDYIHDMKLTQQFAMLNRKAMVDVIMTGMGFTAVETFTTIHNYIDTDAMILRKGSVSAKAGEKLLIPINMRDGSLICSGKGNEDWNCSAPHGAGRLMSRKAAFNALSMEEFQKEMEGIYTTCVVPDTLDESPMAYKSMEEIVAQIGPTAEIIERIRPVYNFKAAD